MNAIESHLQTQLNGSVVVFCSGLLEEVGTTTARILEKHGASVIKQQNDSEQGVVLGDEGSGNMKILAIAKGNESIILPEGINPHAILWMVLNDKDYKDEHPDLATMQQGSVNIDDSSPNKIALVVANLLELSAYKLPKLEWLEGYNITPGNITDLMEGKRGQIFNVEKREVQVYDTNVTSCRLFLMKDGAIFRQIKGGQFVQLQSDEDIVLVSKYEADDADNAVTTEIPFKDLKI